MMKSPLQSEEERAGQGTTPNQERAKNETDHLAEWSSSQAVSRRLSDRRTVAEKAFSLL
jgi:hypothetical protein